MKGRTKICDYYLKFLCVGEKVLTGSKFLYTFWVNADPGKVLQFRGLLSINRSVLLCADSYIHVIMGSYNKRKVREWDAVLDGKPYSLLLHNARFLIPWQVAQKLVICKELAYKTEENLHEKLNSLSFFKSAWSVSWECKEKWVIM